ncbi:MAG TPA: alkaline phosphatase family protein [Vicinamibacterales bacterium]|jgi:predicted AlkP superfamily phosphohydrolase/phosphomutase|nr:alkaline phosphatase family protein [Vicinamibacterales bacterium]
MNVLRLGLPALVCMLAVGLAASCGSRPESRFSQKLVILGFDGMDPDLVQRYIAEKKLPNIARLIEAGGIYDLETSHSPESPTAWASFATGVNAGKHNIYDFLVRDTTTYLPDLGMVRREPAKFLLDWIPIQKPKVLSIRGGESFWVTAGRAGVRSSVLTVPVTFPPEDVPNGELLAGLPLPDIRGTMGTFYYFATDLSRYEEGNTEMGGILKRLVFDGPAARTELVGPPNPIVRQQLHAIRAKAQALTDDDRARIAELEAQEDVRIPFEVRWNRGDAPSATIEIAGESIHLKPGEWSRWIDLEFRVNLFVRLHGMAQMYLINAGQELQLYVSPVNWKPDAPPLPISSPPSFAGDLYERVGRYRTLGWAEATWPLNEGRMDEATFMEDLYRAFDDRAQVILNRIDARNWDLLVGVIESTDRVQHMMWRLTDPTHPMYDAKLAARFGDSIERVYRRCDTFVAEVLERLEPGVPVLIVSDHGFHSWRKAVNLNTWLVQEGYMTLAGQAPGEKKLDDLFGGGEFWENVDWSRTRAYAMGLGQIYFNLRGRESKGIVGSGAEYTQLAGELSARLLTMKDPEDGTPIVRAVYKRDDVYSGSFLHNASDLQVGMEDGYRVSWQTTLGGSPAGIVYANEKKWSGDHGGYDYKTTAGVLISSRRITQPAARIIDISPTVLRYFGVTVPKEIDGRPLF